MKSCILFLILGFLVCSKGYAQVAISTDGSPANSAAMLDVKSTTKGILVPRMTTTEMEAIGSPVIGLLIFNTTVQAFYCFNGSSWALLKAGTSNVLKDADGNTKVEVEKNPNEDIIRFSLGGTEKMTLKSNRLELLNPNLNLFLGSFCGAATTSGTENTGIGYLSLYFNQTGQDNTCLGYNTLLSNVSGSNNVSVGNSVMYSTTGSSNVGVGSLSLFSNTTGYSNTALGPQSLYSNTTRTNLVAVGDSALYNNGTGASTGSHSTANTAIGSKSLYANTTGYNNTANGYKSLYSNITGYSNTASGVHALYFNTTGSNNTANGMQALWSNTTGYSNVAIGQHALYLNTTGHNLVAVGDSALYNQGTSPSGSYGNTGVGSKALFANTNGYYNTATGYNALKSLINGYNNTANGYNALKMSNGYSNTAIGSYALATNSSGNFNTALGDVALYSNNTGMYNTAAGYVALYSNSTGNYNAAFGDWTSYNTISDNNTCIGSSAGDMWAFSNGTFVGSNAYPTAAGYSNCMAIGYNARVDASNKTVIGNASVTSIGGYAGWTTFPSDQKFKKNVSDNVPGLAFITQLRPVTYQLDLDKLSADLKEGQRRDADGNIVMAPPSSADLAARNEKSQMIYTGFIAQEVEAAAKSIGYSFSGVDVPKNEDDFYGLRYAEFVVPLVKAVQEQQVNIKNLETANAELAKKVELLLNRIEILEKGNRSY